MSNERKALLLGLAAVLLWSTAATAFKLALRELNVLQLVAYSVTWSALALLIIVAVQGKLAVLMEHGRSSPLTFLGLGLVNPLAYYLILLTAYDLLPAQQAQAINYTWAIMLSVLAVPLLGHSLSKRDIFAVCVAYSGVLIIATRGNLLTLSFDSFPGVALALASTVLWAFYWILKTRNECDPIVSLCLNFLFSMPLALIICAVFSTLEIVSVSSMLATVYVGLFEMGVTFALWSAALRATSAVSRVANLIFISPLVSLVFIAVILEEAVHPATLVGLALIIPAVFLQHSQAPANRNG
ncbi:MAG: drug/metabolite transporter (DMT)-like permease [Alcanivorax sp.]|jgi:drug/metabolite transporter (DMT)-like permease